jgi:hypothetical protein
MNAGVAQYETGSAWQTMPGDLELKVQAEKLAGPVHGYHLGCYAIEDEAGFHGYAKVFVNRPSSVWSIRHPLAKYSAGPFASSDQAIEAVVRKCEDQLGACETKANRLHRFLLRFL